MGWVGWGLVVVVIKLSVVGWVFGVIFYFGGFVKMWSELD
jgi:hypothetical protein